MSEHDEKDVNVRDLKPTKDAKAGGHKHRQSGSHSNRNRELQSGDRPPGRGAAWQ